MTVNRDLLNVVFGKKNIDIWADLDNDEDEQSSSSRVDYAIAWAPIYLNSLLLARAVPDMAGLVMEDLVARLAGIWLYESRGTAEADATRSPIAHHRKFVNEWVKSYLAGSANITLPNGPQNL